MEIHNGTYKLDGNNLHLTVSPPGRKELVPQSSKIKVQGNTLILRLNDGRNTVMNRISPTHAEDPAIIGRWSVIAADGTDNSTITEYKANGEWASRTPIRNLKGRYSIKGDLLTTAFEDGAIKISKLRFEGGLMFLKSPPKTGPEDRFKRIE
jgi:hypothetical protein